MLAEITPEEFAAALDAVAADVLAAAEIIAPPVDAGLVAERLGIAVAWDDRQAGRARLVRLDAAGSPQGAILLRPDSRVERRHWAIAHELGETDAHEVFARLGVDPREAPPAAREQVANAFAPRLLLPTAWFRQAGRATGWDLFALKARFATASHELIARRMLDFAPPIIISIVDGEKTTLRRSNLPGRPPPWSSTEREAQRLARNTGQPTTVAAGLATIQAWPIHEPHWQREIVRTELPDYEPEP